MTGETPPDGTQMASLGQFITYRLSRIQAKLNAQASRILRDHAGVTVTQWRIIAMLGDGGSCTAAHLSRMSAMDKGLISRNVKMLHADGFITISRDGKDNRALFLNLTDKGRGVFDHTFPRMQARQKALRSHLDEVDHDLLMRAFDKLERAAEDPTVQAHCPGGTDAGAGQPDKACLQTGIALWRGAACPPAPAIMVSQ